MITYQKIRLKKRIDDIPTFQTALYDFYFQEYYFLNIARRGYYYKYEKDKTLFHIIKHKVGDSSRIQTKPPSDEEINIYIRNILEVNSFVREAYFVSCNLSKNILLFQNKKTDFKYGFKIKTFGIKFQ